MKQSKFWEFISTNVITLSTILCGLIVIILDQLEIIPEKLVLTVILALLVLLATSELTEQRKRDAAADEKLEQILALIPKNAEGMTVITFSNPDEALQ